MSADPELSPTEQVLSALRRIIRAVDRQSRALLDRCGLTGPQLLLLREVARDPERRLAEIARALHLSQATLSGIVRRLEGRRLLRRERCPADRRQYRLRLTAAGERVLAEAPPQLQEQFSRAFEALPGEEQRRVLGSLQLVVGLMEARDLATAPILATGPLDASGESTESFLEPDAPSPESP